MAARRKHKKIDRTGVLPRQLTGIVKLLAFLLCLFAPIRLVNALGDEGCADFFGALEGCFVLFSLFGIGTNRAVSNLIRTRIERYGITGAKKNCGTGSFDGIFCIRRSGTFGRCLKRCAVRLILCVALCKNGVFGVIMCARYPDAVLDAARHSGCLWQAENSGQMDTRIRSTFIFRSAPDCSTSRRIRSEGRRTFAEYVLSGGIWCVRRSVFRFMRQSFVYGRLRDLLDKGLP